MSSDRGVQEVLAGVTGVALAGGRSSRMGDDKATLTLVGAPLVARVVTRLRSALAEVIVIGPTSLGSLTPHARVVPDTQPGLGPLGGLYTALGVAETPWVFVAACDMPFLQPALVRRIAEMALATSGIDAVALRAPGGLEPLHTAYHRDLVPLAVSALASPRPSMRGLLSHARVLEVPAEMVASLDPRGLSTFNANTPEEWLQAQHLALETDGAP